jgi:ammonia channel protein AmtB
MVTSNKFTSAEEDDPDIFIQADYVIQGAVNATPPAGPLEPTEAPIGTTSSTICTIQHPPNRLALKSRRKKRKVVAGVVGGTIGLVTLGPFGAIGIGIASALVVKHADRARERKLLRRYEASAASQAGAMDGMPTTPIYAAVHT